MNTTTTQTTEIPATQNEAWGFWGTMNEQASVAWAMALPAIAEVTGTHHEAARIFLDSRYGRHFGDSVQNGLFQGQSLPDAINAAITQWMGWTISVATSQETGIPKGLSYLTGFVIHGEILVEELAA